MAAWYPKPWKRTSGIPFLLPIGRVDRWSMCLAGSGIKGGTVHGKTNKRGTWVDDGEVGYAELFHTYFRALGIDTKHTEYDNGGQPLPLANEDASAIDTFLA